MTSGEMRINVPLEEALNIAGTGMYTNYVIISMGFLLFAALLNIQSISTVLPAAGCDLQLTSAEKGTLTSMIFAGMLFSGPISGFLSDAYGRKYISFLGQAVSTVLMLLGCIAPNTTTLMVLCFINGFALTGALTPVYVLISEFCPGVIRAKAIIISTTIATLGNVYLPGMALLVMPLDIDIPILGMLNFSSWRLFILTSAIPNLIALIFLWTIPETPKFLLNQGKSEATLEVLKRIYAVNQKKQREQFPVLSVILDSGDTSHDGLKEDSTSLLGSIKVMIQRSRVLFSSSYILYTVTSCVMLLCQVGTYNVFMLWLPDYLSKIKQYSYSNEVYNVTLCDLMSSNSSSVDILGTCRLNYDFFSYSLVLGILQIPMGLIVSLFADRIGKKLLLVSLLFMTSLMSTIVVFLDKEYVIISALAAVIIMIAVTFPLIMTFIMEFYPTYVRSTASAFAMIFGRLGASGGSQLMGLLLDNHCEKAYLGISVILIVTAALCLFLPSKKKC